MILLVNQHTVPVFIDIVNAFARTGEPVKLITGRVEEGGAKIADNVQLIESISYRRSSSVSRLLSWIVFTMHYSLYLLVMRKPRMILVVSNPPLAPLITGFICKYREIAFSVLIYDLYPEALVQANFITEGNFVFRYWQRLNRKLLPLAKQIFTLSNSMKKALSGYTNSSTITVIHNWADISYIKPVPKQFNSFFQWHALQNKVIVLYSGNMGLTHDLESLMDAAEKLQTTDRIHFVFAGEGGKKEKLMTAAKRKNLTNVLFLPYQQKNDFPLLMAAADIGVVTLGKGAEGISVPSKTYVNMAAGLCLLSIAPSDSELSRLVTEYEVGFNVEPGNGESVANCILMLSENTDLLKRFKKESLKVSRQFTSANAQEYVNALRV